MSTNAEIAQLRGPILRSVSRSFYLSIRLLPAKSRDPIALAYLLARTTDTIADTAEIDPALRARELANLAAQIQGKIVDRDSLGEFGARQGNEAERRLIQALPANLVWLDAVSPDDRADIRDVLGKINEGQTLDLQRFAEASRVTALETSADLLRYTYLVAGCVGEFWTSLCFRHLPRFASRPVQEMMMLGAEYGAGLQLVNILRDAGNDLRMGRCYVPADELAAIGVTPAELREHPDRALPVVNAWLDRAAHKLAAGIDYSCSIRPMRVRLATVLPALIGARTLALLREAGAEIFDMKIKVERREVRKILLRMVTSLASPRTVRETFKALSS